ncbi:MAG: hypothetical protein HY910_04380 [Desulfarculus sp.]|nr:hypothetical protein [Desulfarculus sp.]
MVCALGQAAWAAPELLPGRYQLPGQPVFCELRPAGEGAWQLTLWQGGPQVPAPGGLALSARLLAENGGPTLAEGARTAGGPRLAGAWQALPWSCCPGQGRLEIEILAADSLAFRLFTPSLDQAPWPVLAEQVWRRVADLPQPDRGLMLAGGWRLALWYTDLLPQAIPADPQEGLLTLSPQGGGAQGAWQGQAGQVRLEPAAQGALFTYSDSQARFEIKADLRPLAQGLAYEGHFLSTLGEGRLLLTRLGLPAQPPGNPLAGQGELSGLWVDRRTGSDFVLIKGGAQALEFTAYGGDRERPRYLSQGQARAVAPGLLEGTAQDQKGQCCGNQARLSFKVLSPERIQARALWWPQDRPDPGTPLEEPYLLERARPASLTPAEDNGDQWPEVFTPQPGLLAPGAGAVRVRFNWQPSAPGQVATLFCQGGHGQELDLFMDAQGRLAGRLATAGGLVSAQSQAPVSPNQPHEAWLFYRAGGQLRLVLDGREVASTPLPQPWNGSRSPYLVGASRWPLRDFEGSIENVDLWQEPPDPAAPGPPTLTLKLSEPPEEPTPVPASVQGTATAPLLRLYNPRLLRHAYAVGQEQAQDLHAQGYASQGPVGRLWLEPQPGGLELWAFRHREQGHTLLQTQDSAPPGFEPLGRLGYVLGQARGPSQALHQLEGGFDDSLRGRKITDLLYTSRGDLLPRLQEQGYGPPRLICHLAPEPEPTLSAPLTYTWQGAWGGDGWGRFFILTQGQDLLLYWYYGESSGPRYLGRLRMNPEGQAAQGLAVGQPGPMATYYRLELAFDLQAPQGPRLRLKSWRLAAPLDDGRLVSFVKPQLTESLLVKTGQTVPDEETATLERFMAGAASDPQAQYQAALEQARGQDRLLER